MKPDLTTVGPAIVPAPIRRSSSDRTALSLPMSRTVVTPAATPQQGAPAVHVGVHVVQAGDQCAARAVNHDLIRIRHDSILFLDSSDPAAEDRHRGRRAQPPASGSNTRTSENRTGRS